MMKSDSTTNANTVKQRQIYLPRDVTTMVQTQKVNDKRPPRQRPTLQTAFVEMFKQGLAIHESGKRTVEMTRRNVTDPGYYVLSFEASEYERAEKIAADNGLAVIDVIVALITAAAPHFKFSEI